MTAIIHPKPVPAASTVAQPARRQFGFDVARALAVFGMVIVNFKIVMGAENQGPQWLAWLVGLLDGRAAATFVILAGVGMSLLSRRARLSGDRRAMAAKRTALLKRAAFLFCFGLAYAPLWPADILHFYGIYLLIGVCLLNASDRRLWSLAAAFIIGFVVLLLVFDYDHGWDWESLTYVDFWTAAGMVRHLFYNGFHPVVPWTAFLLVGIWLGRRDMTDPTIRRKIFAGGLAATLLAETASWVLTPWMLIQFTGQDPMDIQALCGTAPIPPMPFYMLSAGGTALMLIVACVVLTDNISAVRRLLNPLITTGQFALTFYVAHVVLGMGVMEALGRLNNQELTTAVVSALCFCAIGVTAAVVWRKFFDRGPLEWVLRKITA
jgi:uncharacterized membrane protein YeiB